MRKIITSARKLTQFFFEKICRLRRTCGEEKVHVFAEHRKVIKTKGGGPAVLNNLLLICSISVLCYVAIELPLIVPPVEDFCEHYHRTKIISYGNALVAVYIALWLRVFNAFYWHRVTRRSTNKFAKAFNIFAAVALAAILTANYTVFLGGPFYTTTGFGCSPNVDVTQKDRLKWIALGASTSLCQFLLLASLGYPLYVHRKKMLGSGVHSTTLIPLIKRAACMTLICIFSDIASTLFAAFYSSSTAYEYHIALSCNLLVNMHCAVFSCVDWRKRLFPFSCCIGYEPALNRRSAVADSSRWIELGVVTVAKRLTHH